MHWPDRTRRATGRRFLRIDNTFLQWQPYRESGAGSDAAANPDCSALAFNSVFDNRETKSRPAGITRPCFIDPIEPLENAWKLLRWYAVTCVDDRDRKCAVLDFCRDANLTARFVVVDGVVEEI